MELVPGHSDPDESIRSLEVRCRRELARAAGPHFRGSRKELRGAVRRALRPHRKDRRSLLWVLRNVAASSAFAIALIGVDARPADAADFFYVQRLGSENPFAVLPGSHIFRTEPQLADLDGDGDLDILAGYYHPPTGFIWWENTGTAKNAAFANPATEFNDLGIIVFAQGYRTAASLADLDQDGDLDMVATRRMGPPAFGENLGSVTSPAFAIEVIYDPETFFAVLPLEGVDPFFSNSPALGDIDGDGDFDLLTGHKYGGTRFSENIGTPQNHEFIERTGAENPFDGIVFPDLGDGAWASPTLVDLDNDGDLDLVGGQYYFGQTFYYENVGTPTVPSFVERTGAGNPFAELSIGQNSQPHFGDIDGDGDLDMITSGGESGDYFILFERIESHGLPTAWWTPLAAAASLLASGWRRLRASFS